MWAALNAIDAHKVTQVGAENAEKHFKQEMDELRGTVAALATKAA